VTEVVLPSGVTAIGFDVFRDFPALTSVTLPVECTKIEGETEWGGGQGAFWRCSSLVTVALPNGRVSIGRSAFCDCWSLTEVTIPQVCTTIDR
jgi:hypothetical protein